MLKLCKNSTAKLNFPLNEKLGKTIKKQKLENKKTKIAFSGLKKKEE